MVNVRLSEMPIVTYPVVIGDDSPEYNLILSLLERKPVGAPLELQECPEYPSTGIENLVPLEAAAIVESQLYLLAGDLVQLINEDKGQLSLETIVKGFNIVCQKTPLSDEGVVYQNLDPGHLADTIVKQGSDYYCIDSEQNVLGLGDRLARINFDYGEHLIYGVCDCQLTRYDESPTHKLTKSQAKWLKKNLG
jgi:hypothetical protein